MMVVLACSIAYFWAWTFRADQHDTSTLGESTQLVQTPGPFKNHPLILKTKRFAQLAFPGKLVTVKGRNYAKEPFRYVGVTGTSINARLEFDSDGQLEKFYAINSISATTGNTRNEVQEWLEDVFESKVHNLRMISRFDDDFQIQWANEKDGNRVFFEIGNNTYEMAYRNGTTHYLRRVKPLPMGP